MENLDIASYRVGQIYFCAPDFPGTKKLKCTSDRETTENIAFCSSLPK